ncbi:MAG: hypothetical protein Q9168_003285 [Polycauliona sp. 1 TL-2023]
MTSSSRSGFAIRRNGTCPSNEVDCGATAAPFHACCPRGSSCPQQYNVACCPSAANCTQTLLKEPRCANNRWSLYDNHGYFCCAPGTIGYNASRTFSDGCAAPGAPPRGAQLLAVVSAGQTATSSSPGPTTSLVSSPSPPPDSGSSSSNTGAIAGGVIGGVAAIVIAAIIAFYFFRKRKNRPRSDNGRPIDKPSWRTHGGGIHEKDGTNIPVATEADGVSMHEMPALVIILSNVTPTTIPSSATATGVSSPEALMHISLYSRPASPSGSNLNHARDESAAREISPRIQLKQLDHRQQTWSFLFPQTLCWLATVVIAALIVTVLLIYNSKGNFTRADKNVFNVIVTGLSVGLGINFFEAFKESAKGLRWRILADSRHSVRQVYLILSIESLWKVFVLAIESIPSRPWTILACAVWAAQISVALVTLTLDMVDGKSFNDTYTNIGSVNTSYLTCYEDDVDGQGPGSSFAYQDGNSMKHIEIPASSPGASATTYMYKGFEAPQETNYTCGPRCMWLWAYRNPAFTDEGNVGDPPGLYKCRVTISEVSNTWRASQTVPDDVARIAAVSIALQGRWSGQLDNPNFNQYQFYSYATPWEIHHRNASEVGSNMAKFATGSIAEMADRNTPLEIPGRVPYLGSHLEIRWQYVAALLAGIPSRRTLSFAIKDDSLLAIAFATSSGHQSRRCGHVVERQRASEGDSSE